MTKTAHPQLALLPGLGADSRLLAPQLEVFPHARALDWIDHRPGDTLTGYAERMAAVVDGLPGKPHTLVLGGVSFGGMVALEMARYCDCAAVVLIASCHSGRVIPGHLRFVQKLAQLVPSSILGVGTILGPLLAKEFGDLSPQQRRVFNEMFADSDPAFSKWAASSIMSWKPADTPAVPLFHIHGDRDRLIPCSKVSPDQVIPGGGHLINLTHASEVNEFIARAVATVGSG